MFNASIDLNKSTKAIATAYNNSDEMALIKAAQGDPRLFEPLYKQYYEAVFRFVYQRMDDKNQAFDITAQVFLKAMNNLKGYKHQGFPFSSWLYRIAKNELYDHFRKGKARRTINIDSEQVKHLTDETCERPDYETHMDAMLTCLSDLPEEELQLIEMRFFENRPFKEIGEILEITENNAKVRTYRLLEKLRAMITEKPSKS